ncbi:NAD(P)-binding domain protein, partial [Metarhizium hybridum]
MGKLFVIFGATGQQGGALIDFIQSHAEFSKQFRLRAVTRDTSKPSSEALKKKGVEVVQANLDDPSTLDAAVKGAYAIFAVTDFWATGSAEAEIVQGKAVADAGLAAGTHLYIWSSLPHVTKMTAGEVTNVHHFDSKAEVELYVRDLSFPSCVFFTPGSYMQNVWNTMLPQMKLDSDGQVIYPFAWPPEMPVPLIDITDTGKYLAPVLRDPAKYHGQRITAATAYYSAQSIVDTWTKVSGKPVRLLKEEEVDGFAQSELQKGFMRPSLLQSKYLYFGLKGPEDLKWTHAQLDRNDPLTTWEEFLVRGGPWFTNLSGEEGVGN